MTQLLQADYEDLQNALKPRLKHTSLLTRPEFPTASQPLMFKLYMKI